MGAQVAACFSQRKKAKTPSFDFVSLEKGQGSVLSVINTLPTRSIRYFVLVKGPYAGAEYTQVNVLEKFVLYASLTEGDEVMFTLNEETLWKINIRSCGEVNLALDSISVVQECLQYYLINPNEMAKNSCVENSKHI